MSMSILTKICSACKQPKTSSEFVKNKNMRDKLSSRCKKCHSEKQKPRDMRPEVRTARMEYNKAYFKTQAGKIASRRYREKYPQKIKARAVINAAIRFKGYPRPSGSLCSICQQNKAQHYHHHNGYENPFDVIPICLSCHAKEHYSL